MGTEDSKAMAAVDFPAGAPAACAGRWRVVTLRAQPTLVGTKVGDDTFTETDADVIQ